MNYEELKRQMLFIEIRLANQITQLNTEIAAIKAELYPLDVEHEGLEKNKGGE